MFWCCVRLDSRRSSSYRCHAILAMHLSTRSLFCPTCGLTAFFLERSKTVIHHTSTGFSVFSFDWLWEQSCFRGAGVRRPSTQVSRKPLYGSRPILWEATCIYPPYPQTIFVFFATFLIFKSDWYDFFTWDPVGAWNSKSCPSYVVFRYELNFYYGKIRWSLREYKVVNTLAICQKFLLWHFQFFC